MITLAPLRNEEGTEKIFNEKNICFNACSDCLLARDGEEILGFCLYDLDKNKILIKYLEPLNDIYLADGILRSTLHIAAENGVMQAFYDETLSEEFLEKIGFIKERKEKSLDIDKLFKSCCGCNT